jgi:outer membrane protein assembly factor BamB
MDNKNSQIFRMDANLLYFDYSTNVLLCKDIENKRKLWIKKIDDPGIINDIVEDDNRFFVAFESGEKSGVFLAISKKDGSTLWDIPGRAYMYRIFLDYIYLIFIDDSGQFFLIKTAVRDGSLIWHHNVSQDLCGYIINPSVIILDYLNGHKEKIDIEKGSLI